MSARLPPELTIGFDELDAQHRGLFDRIEVAIAAVRAGDLAATRGAVSALGDALMAHFTAEEAIMAESLYPDRGRHKAAHDLFMQDFAQLGVELAAGSSDLVGHWITVRLPEWVKFHIGVNDLPLGQYLSARRFRPEPPRASTPKPRLS